MSSLDIDKPNGPRSRKGAQTRARMIDAAKEVFEEVGFLEARISDIGERAGLSHGSFYHYFESKEEIFREVAERVYDRLSAPLGLVILAPSSSATAAERIHEAIRQNFESYRSEARIIGVIEQVSRYDEHVSALIAERQARCRDQIAESIRHLQQRGLADPTIDPPIAAAAIGALASRFAEMWLVQGYVECSMDAAVDQVTTFLVNALGLHSGVTTGRRKATTRRTRS